MAGPGLRQDEPPEPPEEYEDFAPLTAEELAEVRRAARGRPAGRRGGHHRAARAWSARFGAGVPGRVDQPGGGVRPGYAAGCAAGGAGLALVADAAVGGRRVHRRLGR